MIPLLNQGFNNKILLSFTCITTANEYLNTKYKIEIIPQLQYAKNR